MELYHQHNFLDDVLAQRRMNNPWETLPMEMNEVFSSGWNLDCNFDATNPTTYMPNQFTSLCEGFSSPLGLDLEHDFNALRDVYSQFSNEILTPQISDSTYNIHGIGTPMSGPQITDSSSYSAHDTPPNFPYQEDYTFTLMEEEEPLGLVADEFQTLDIQAACKMEPAQSPELPFFNMGTCSEHRKNRTKKVEGQPSKNLMAERRRRKRLNDRLSMLRSIVPKISKMDRTSILGDTIDYVKELLEKIQNLQEETKSGSKQVKLMELLKDIKPNEMLVRNSPKFEVEQRSDDTRIEICCTAKPGLLFSTLSTLEAFGLEIQQCVISCFNDFAMQASCSEEAERMTVVTPEEMKQALFRNAGYGGRCL